MSWERELDGVMERCIAKADRVAKIRRALEALPADSDIRLTIEEELREAEADLEHLRRAAADLSRSGQNG